MFLLESISKPIGMTALMTLFDKGAFQLDDPLKKFIPKFTGEGRDDVTLRHLLSHVSGLPWADPASETICVALTSLPARAVQPHPRDLAAEKVAATAS